MRTVRVGDVFQNFAVYPRKSPSQPHIDRMIESLEAGHVFDPIVVCAKTLAVADGMHRVNAYFQKYGVDHKIEVLEKHYRNAKELMLDAIRYNAIHGLPLSLEDRQHCVLTCRSLGIEDSEVASALKVRQSTVATLAVSRSKGPATLLTSRQVSARQKLSRTGSLRSAEERQHEKDLITAALDWWVEETRNNSQRLRDVCEAYTKARATSAREEGRENV